MTAPVLLMAGTEQRKVRAPVNSVDPQQASTLLFRDEMLSRSGQSLTASP